MTALEHLEAYCAATYRLDVRAMEHHIVRFWLHLAWEIAAVVVSKKVRELRLVRWGEFRREEGQ
jgi:hypothetical protein